MLNKMDTNKCTLVNVIYIIYLGWNLLVPSKKLKFTPKRLPQKKLFGHQQNRIPVNLTFKSYKVA